MPDTPPRRGVADYCVAKTATTDTRQRRFCSTTPLGQYLREHREEVIALLTNRGIINVHVFSSTVCDEEDPASDIDILVTADLAPSLFGLARADLYVTNLLGALPSSLCPTAR